MVCGVITYLEVVQLRRTRA